MKPPRIPEGIVNSPEALVKHAIDLNDVEIKQVSGIWADLVQRYGTKRNTVDNLEALRDEALNRFAQINVLVTLDPAPCFHGEPPIIEIIGKISSDLIHKYGFDHERQKWQVLRANERNEDYLGQKERIIVPRHYGSS